jgi:hypothetical protein
MALLAAGVQNGERVAIGDGHHPAAQLAGLGGRRRQDDRERGQPCPHRCAPLAGLSWSAAGWMRASSAAFCSGAP